MATAKMPATEMAAAAAVSSAAAAVSSAPSRLRIGPAGKSQHRCHYDGTYSNSTM